MKQQANSVQAARYLGLQISKGVYLGLQTHRGINPLQWTTQTQRKKPTGYDLIGSEPSSHKRHVINRGYVPGNTLHTIKISLYHKNE
jgi:hypothetical protein